MYGIHGKKIYYSNLYSWMLTQPEMVLIWNQNHRKSLNIANSFLSFPGCFQSVCWARGILCKEVVKIPALAPTAAAWRSQDSVTEVALAKLLAPSDRPVCLPYLCHLTVGFVLFWALYVDFFILCVARTIIPRQTHGWRGAEERWGRGRYSFKEMEEQAL